MFITTWWYLTKEYFGNVTETLYIINMLLQLKLLRRNGWLIEVICTCLRNNVKIGVSSSTDEVACTTKSSIQVVAPTFILCCFNRWRKESPTTSIFRGFAVSFEDLQFLDTEVSSWLLRCVHTFNSTMHELHSSTQAKHTCLISNAVCLDKLKLQVQTNSSWPGVGIGLILLGHKLLVCFPIDIIDIVQHSQERRINTFRQTKGEEEKVGCARHKLKQ